MPLYSLEMQQRFARIEKQRVDEARKSIMLILIPRRREVKRLSANAGAVVTASKPTPVAGWDVITRAEASNGRLPTSTSDLQKDGL